MSWGEVSSAEMWLGLVLLAGWLLYRWSTSSHRYWADRGVPFVKPVPLFGTSLRTSLGRESLVDAQLRNYRHFGDSPFGGLFTFRRPKLFLKDPGLVEQVMIKDFSVWYNRGFKPDLNLEPLSAHLVNLEDGKWKALRSKLTPAFSSGKLRGMQEELLRLADQLVDHLDKHHAATGQPFDVKNVMSNFSVDLVGSVAFGLDLNSLDNPDSEFRRIGSQVFKATLKGRLRFALRSQFPRLLTLLRWKSLPQETEDFFVNLVKETVEYREKNKVRRSDFLQLLIDLRKQDEGKPQSEEDLVFDDRLMTANAFVFLLAGFDTTATTISFLLYELAEHPEIQEAVHREIAEKVAKHGGPTYDAVKDMTLLDHCLSESMRLHPPAGAVVRKSRAAYKVPGSDLTLPPGFFAFVPIYSLQRDPKYWPDPESFKPERWVDPSSIVKGTYLPFGDGPRICIGLRLAKMEVKVAVVKLLLSYKLSVNPRTKRPFTYNTKTLFLTPVGGIWLDLKRRE